MSKLRSLIHRRGRFGVAVLATLALAAPAAAYDRPADNAPSAAGAATASDTLLAHTNRSSWT